MFVGVFYVNIVEAASSQTVCIARADPQTSPQECPPATGERTDPLQDNDRVSLIHLTRSLFSNDCLYIVLVQ